MRVGTDAQAEQWSTAAMVTVALLAPIGATVLLVSGTSESNRATASAALLLGVAMAIRSLGSIRAASKHRRRRGRYGVVDRRRLRVGATP